jgi:hypothetical protein
VVTKIAAVMALVVTICLVVAFPGPWTIGALVVVIVAVALSGFLLLDAGPTDTQQRPNHDRLPGPGESAGIGPGGV